MKKIALLGSTGSIGTQALDVIGQYPDRFRAEVLLARSSAEMLFDQVRRFHPSVAGLIEEPKYLPEDLKNTCEWVFGENAMTQVIRAGEIDDVLVSVVGIAGLSAVMEALTLGKQVLLANKEPLVAGGAIVTEAAKRAGKPLIPIDSEHSAIFQCLEGSYGNRPARLILTASGGPFRTWTRDDIEYATKNQALRHPNWNMGKKITIDSASMMNKALEVIEARWLFNVSADRIEVAVHPESVIHSMVEYEDGAIIAQLGTPDMRLPILYAMARPERLPFGGKRLDFSTLRALTFEKPDFERFPALRLGYEALSAGGTATAILNGANEIAVDAFLHDRIRFGGIASLVEETMSAIPIRYNPSLDEVFDADRTARRMAAEILASGRFS